MKKNEKQVLGLLQDTVQNNAFSLYFNALLVTTVNVDGVPSVSRAAYMRVLGEHYILIGQWSACTAAIINDAAVSFTLIDIQAGGRYNSNQKVVQQHEAVEVDSHGELYDYIMRIFGEKFGRFTRFLDTHDGCYLFRFNSEMFGFI